MNPKGLPLSTVGVLGSSLALTCTPSEGCRSQVSPRIAGTRRLFGKGSVVDTRDRLTHLLLRTRRFRSPAEVSE